MIPRWTPGQWVLRAVIALAPLVAVLVSIPAGASVRVWFLLVLLGVSGSFAVFPASEVGIFVLLLVGAWWATAPADDAHPMALVAAAAVLACHVSALLAAYGPQRLPVDRALVRLWLVRATSVFLAAPAVWLVAEVMSGAPAERGIWVVGLSAALVGAVAVLVSFGGWSSAPAGKRTIRMPSL